MIAVADEERLDVRCDALDDRTEVRRLGLAAVLERVDRGEPDAPAGAG